MSFLLNYKDRMCVWILTTCMILGILAQSGDVLAQAQNNIRVIVMGEDEDPDSVSRKSNIYDRVLAEMKESMLRKGFQVVDEEMLVVDLGWWVTDRRPKTELIQAAKLANQESQANLYSRALTLFRIYADLDALGFANRIHVRVEGEMYDLESNSFLGSFELPRMSVSAPAECSRFCIVERVGDKAREIAAGVGDVLGTKLAYLSPEPSDGYNNERLAATGDRTRDPRCTSPVTTYTLEFKRFSTPDILSIMNIISNSTGNLPVTEQFPCYVRHDLIQSGNSTVKRYSYNSTVNRATLYGWFNLILMDLGHVPDQNIIVINSGNSIIFEQISGNSQPSADITGSRFQ